VQLHSIIVHAKEDGWSGGGRLSEETTRGDT
jgi:hypothetical protein